MTSSLLRQMPEPIRHVTADDPVASVLLGVAGSALILSRDRLPRVARGVAGLGGLALLGVAAYGPLSQLVRRLGTRRRAIEVQGTYLVLQPVERVFAFCRDFENFPRFIGVLRSVQDHGDGHSVWSASTPAGRLTEWTAVTTKYVPNRVIAWESTGASPVHATGLLRFRPEDGHTCLEATLTFTLAGRPRLGDSLAALVAPPRARQLETDLRRMVHYLNTAPEAELAAYGA